MNEQRVAIVTGASRGIGAATAQALAEAGFRIALVATDRTALDGTAEGLATASLVIPGDLGEMAFVESIVPRVVEAWGRVDVLINNAAWREIISMRRISLESWERTLRICLTAPAFLARAAAADMQRRQKGAIINVGSVMARQSAGNAPAYTACKGGLESLTYELASLYGPVGVRVLCVQPGAIDTEMSRGVAPDDASNEIRQFSEEMIMLGRWGRSSEIAATIAFLASDAASYITGTTLDVDGGWLRQHLPLMLKRRHFSDDYS